LSDIKTNKIIVFEIKTTLRLHLTPVRIEHHHQQMLVRMQGKRNPHTLLVGM
jgi:hypothetical protein